MEQFKGYVRSDGRVGLKNNVICIATVMCASAVVEGIAREVPEVIPVMHTDGCETRRVRTLYFTKTLENICRHPNNYAVILIGLGCERDNAKEIAERLSAEGVNIWARIIQEDGGCQAIIKEGAAKARSFLSEAATLQPVSISADRLVIGVETADHIQSEDPLCGRPCNTSATEKAAAAAEGISQKLQELGASVILPSVYGKKDRFKGNDICSIRYADPVPAGKGYFAIDQDGDRWKGRKDGVFNMDITESLLSMFASGAQALILSTGVSVPLGFSPAPLIKYSVEKDSLMEADVIGCTDPVHEIMEKLLRVSNGEPTYDEMHNSYNDLICTYRRTNIY